MDIALIKAAKMNNISQLLISEEIFIEKTNLLHFIVDYHNKQRIYESKLLSRIVRNILG